MNVTVSKPIGVGDLMLGRKIKGLLYRIINALIVGSKNNANNFLTI